MINMNKILTLIFVFIGFSAVAQDCTEVKTGTFVIEHDNYGNSKLIRTESSQDEIVEELGIHTKYELIWTDNCNYVLFNRTSIKGNLNYPDAKATDSLFVEITELIPDGYKFRATSNFSDFVSTGIVKREK